MQLSIALALAITAQAQEAPVQSSEKVQVEGSPEQARQASVQLKRTVPRSELERHGDTSVLDVLRRQSGITVTGASGSGKGEVRMRGLGGNYVQILVNGEAAPPGFALDTLSPALVERIEISQMPNVALGTQAVAGVINIILRQAGSRPQRQLTLGLNHTDGYRNPTASANYSDKHGALSWVVAANARHLKGDERYLSEIEGGKAPLQRTLEQFNHDHAKSWSLAPRLHWKRSDGTALNWQVFANDHRYDSVGRDQTEFVAGPVTVWGNDLYVSHGSNRSLRNQLSWSQPLGEHTKLEIKVGASNSRIGHASDIRYLDGAGQVAHFQATRKDSETSALSLLSSLRFHYLDDHALLFGTEFKRDRMTSRQSDWLDGVSQLAGLASHTEVDIDQRAGFIQDEWEITPRLAVNLGLRHDVLRLVSRDDLGRRTTFRQGVTSPVGQLVWKLPGSEKDQLRLGLARTWRVPSPDSFSAGRQLSQDNTVTSPDRAGNPTLKPELAWGVDLAYEHYLPGNGVLSATVFSRRIEDAMVTVRRLEDGRWVSMLVNAGQASSHGVELEAKAKLSQLIANAPAINLRVNLSRYWSSVDAIPGPDNRLNSQTPLSFQIGADYAFPALPISAGASFGFVKNGTVRLSEYESEFKSNQRTLDAYALWRIGPMTQLRLSVANLLRDPERKNSRFVTADSWQTKHTSLDTFRVFRLLLEAKF
ncbi:TonB-dependent receptor plug domain-containing protein [Chitinimonas lacunae]|uniref:TonB-dependent receptor plug domain-containing protein n=1 Tax=Chitinimonas lacunae TaxID=1963018 RepID=A0ABV8MSM4_9NEIS